MLGHALAGHDNALNLVRLFLAALVVFGHSSPLGGFPSHNWHDFSGTAVNGFFAISGYLIAGSRVRTSLQGFLWRRALRIYPGFWVALITTAFIVAPLAALIGGETWVPQSAVGYVVNNATLYIRQWHIEELLTSVPYPGAWNGSLWTLWFEGMAYLMAGVLLSFSLVRRRPLPFLAGLLLVVLVLQVLAPGALDISTGRYLQALRLAGFFLAGMTLWAARDRVPARWWLGVPACLAVIALQWTPAPWSWALTALPIAYATLWLGAALPTRMGSRTDLSYGTYIYAFPFQQLLAVLGAHTVLGYWGYSIASLLCALAAAWVSWTVVEKPAMRWKSLVR
ncbi:acyltransferase [Kocuria sp. KSNUG]|uniref:acyltransferase family protein n=1 Tax=Kocuria sp. KSNUG TaxID=3136676 RepID=UPI003C2ED7D4